MKDDGLVYWCEERDGTISGDECIDTQGRAKCEGCDEGKRAKSEAAERKLLAMAGNSKEDKPESEAVVEDVKKCVNGCGRKRRKGWASGLCMVCARDINKGKGAVAQSKAKKEEPDKEPAVKGPETIMRHAQHDKSMSELVGPGTLIEIDSPDDIVDQRPQVVLKSFDIASLSDDCIEKFLVALSDAKISYTLKVQVLVEPEG